MENLHHFTKGEIAQLQFTQIIFDNLVIRPVTYWVTMCSPFSNITRLS